MRSYLAAAVQMTASSSKEENLAKAETFVRLAAERGASVIVLPEVFTWRGSRAEDCRRAIAALPPSEDLDSGEQRK